MPSNSCRVDSVDEGSSRSNMENDSLLVPIVKNDLARALMMALVMSMSAKHTKKKFQLLSRCWIMVVRVNRFAAVINILLKCNARCTVFFPFKFHQEVDRGVRAPLKHFQLEFICQKEIEPVDVIQRDMADSFLEHIVFFQEILVIIIPDSVKQSADVTAETPVW